MTDTRLRQQVTRPAPSPSPAHADTRNRGLAWQLLLSLLGFGPIPATRVVDAIALVLERRRTPAPDSGSTTTGEQAVRHPVLTRATRQLDNATATATNLITAITRNQQLRTVLGAQATDLAAASITGPYGEQLTPAEARTQHDTLQARLRAETDAGSIAHLAQPRHRAREIALLAIDYPVFFLAMLTLFNVNLRQLAAGVGPAVIGAVAASIFALLGTVLFAVVLRTLGRHHRVHKDADGSLAAARRRVRRLRIEQAGGLLLIAAAAAVMATRVLQEGLSEGAPLLLTVVLGIFLAALIGWSGWINYQAERMNGSPLVDQMRHLAVRLLARDQQLQSLRAQQRTLTAQIAIDMAKLHRALVEAPQAASRTVTGSSRQRVMLWTRSWSGDQNPLPAPELHAPLLVQIAQQLAEAEAQPWA